MRKICLALMACLIVCWAFSAHALAAQPGDTVQIPITLNNTNGCYIKITVSYDTNAFEYSSISCNYGQAYGQVMTMSDVNVLPSGVCGTLTLKVKSGAVNGTYTIGASVAECWDFNENYGTASASAASVTITGGICPHGSTAWTTVREATCTAAGEKAEKCNACGDTLNTEAIPAAGHDEGTWATTKEATCTEAGEKALKCGKCGGIIKTEAISETGHDDGTWTTTKAATCTETGEKTLKCGKCSAIIDTEAIPAAGHDDGTWATTKEATCTEAGEKALKCGKCSATIKTEAIPAAGHDKGTWTTTKEATCTEAGEKALKCGKCSATIKTEAIPAAGHDKGTWTIIKEATCTNAGEKALKCGKCSAIIGTEAIPAVSHDEGAWTTVKQATREEEGEKQRRCTACDALLETAAIPKVTIEYFYQQYVCAAGLRFCDYSEIDQYRMFRPLDLSQDGICEVALISGAGHKVGKLLITVAGDKITVSREMVNPRIEIHDEFFTFFPNITEVKSVEPAELSGYALEDAISIAADLQGDTQVILYYWGHVTYHSMMNDIWWYSLNGKTHTALVEELKILMAE